MFALALNALSGLIGKAARKYELALLSFEQLWKANVNFVPIFKLYFKR
jgi:hypothetical protein